MSLDTLKSVLSVAGEHLGDMLWWSLADARVDRKTLESLWQSASLPPEFLPEAPTPEKALKTAARKSSTGQTERPVRLTKEDEHEVVFAVVRETKHQDGSAPYKQEARVILDRASELVTTDQPCHDLAMTIHVGFVRLRHTHTPDDIRRARLKALDSCAAVTLRDLGGVYWVPAAAIIVYVFFPRPSGRGFIEALDHSRRERKVEYFPRPLDRGSIEAGAGSARE